VNMSTSSRLRPSAESGSAYIITLLALVVLTILGLGLALITQTEMQVGATEITQQRMLYAADSGINHSMARVQSKFSCAPVAGSQLQLFDQDATGFFLAAGLRENVEVSPALPMVDAPCALCQINNAAGSGQYGEQIYYQIHHGVTSDAQRVKGADPEPMAERQVSSFFMLQPWPEIPECFQYGTQDVSSKVKL